jgi:DNA-binding Lrp family transcriptional regulator
MKEVELKLVAELMKNSRRSDRELAKAIGVSQPTVSRLIKKLEKEGLIKEYTMIPDFAKLGHNMLGLTFVRLKKTLSSEEIEKAREFARRETAESRFPIVMLERGWGLGYDGVIVSLYKDYSSYARYRSILKKYPFLESSAMDSFLINLLDTVRYLPFSLKKYADLLLDMEREKENRPQPENSLTRVPRAKTKKTLKQK